MGGGAALIEFRTDGSTIKTVSLEIPEGEESILLPEEALPTENDLAEYGLRVKPAMTNPIAATDESVILGEVPESKDSVIPVPEPEPLTNQILGWVDTKDESKTIYTTDKTLYGTEGYAPIGEFVLYGDTVFEAVTPSNKDEIAGQARNDASDDNDAGGKNDDDNSVIPAPEPESLSALGAEDTEIGVLSEPTGDHVNMESRLDIDTSGIILSAFTNDLAQPARIFIPKQAYYNDGLEYGLHDITGIGDSAFTANTIGSIEFDTTNVIETIGDGAFQSRTDMTIANGGFVSNSLKSIGANAFQNSGITQIQLPATLTTIGTYAFAQTKLTSLDIPSSPAPGVGVKTIPSYMLYQVATLNILTFHDGLTAINSNAFDRLTSTVSLVIKIPSSVTTMGSNIFEWSGGNISIDVSDWAEPGDITWGGNTLRYFCGNILYKDTDSNSWWYFKDGKLGGIKPVAAAKFKANGELNNTGANAYNATAFPGSTLSLADYPIKIVEGKNVLEIPARIPEITEGTPVTEILRNAFGYYYMNNAGVGLSQRLRSIQTLEFAEPSSITKIGECAFWNSITLTSLTLPSSLTTIQPYAFEFNRVLENVNIPAAVTTIGASAFTSCYTLGSVIFEGAITSGTPDTTTSKINSIAPNAFESNAALYDITFEGRTMTGDVAAPSGAPWRATAATVHYVGSEDLLPPGTYVVGPWVYNETSKTIIGYKYKIGGYLSGAADGNPVTSDLVVPATLSRPTVEGVDTEYPAEKTTNITDLSTEVMRALGTKLGTTKAFNSVTIEEGIQTISGFDQLRLTDGSVTIPASATNIKDYSFRNTGIASLTFVGADNDTAQLTKIGINAFQGAKLSTIVFPNTLKTIESRAFYEPVQKLKGEIVIPASVTSIDGQAFLGHTFNTATEGDPNSITQFTVKRSRPDTPDAVFNTKPWGVTPSTGPVIFNASTTGISVSNFAKILPSPNPKEALGVTANLSYTVNLPSGDGISKIVITGENGYEPQKFPAIGADEEDPIDGTFKGLKRIYSGSFLVDRNGLYTLTLYTKMGQTIVATRNVTEFGTVTITADDPLNLLTTGEHGSTWASTATAEAILGYLNAGGAAIAIDLDTGIKSSDTGSPKPTLSISSDDVTAFRNTLTGDATTVDITVNAEFAAANGMTNRASKTITVNMSGKIHRIFEIRSGDEGLGKFTGTNDTSIDKDYAGPFSTIATGDIPTAETTNVANAKFDGWYLSGTKIGSGTTTEANNAALVSAIENAVVGENSLTYEARFIVDSDGDGKDDRLQGVKKFNYDSAKGSVTYNGLAPTGDTDGVFGVSAGTFSIKADIPSNLKAVVATVTSDNYQFMGWSKNGSNDLIGDEGIDPNTDPFVPDTVAHPEIYNAVFNNGIKFVWSTDLADGTGNSILYVPQDGAIQDLGVSATAPTPTEKTGLHFDGWATAVDGTGNGMGTAKSVETVTNDIQTEPKTYYAKFSETAVYTVRYNADGANTAPVDKVGTVKWSDSGLLPAVIKTGYTLLNWTVQGDDTPVTADTKYSELAGASRTNLIGITLVAHWTARADIALSFGKNTTVEVTGDPLTSKNALTYDAKVGTLPIPVRTGYNFLGWATTESATVSDFDEDIYVNWTSPTKTVWAVWEAKTITVNFNVNGTNTTAGTASTSADFDSQVGTLPAIGSGAPTRVGYTFVGWSTNSGADNTANFISSTVLDTELVGINTELNVYAVWSADTYTVTYNGNGATQQANPATGSVTSPATTVAALPTSPEKTGYAFVGWFDTAGTTGGNQFTTSTTVNASVDVWARWTINQYDIKYTLNGGMFDIADTHPDVYTVEDSIDISNPTRVGYTFEGFTATGTLDINSAAPDVNIPVGKTGLITLEAHWSVNKNDPTWATVSFNANGGTGAPASILYNRSEGKLADGAVFPSAAPSLIGYTFANWNTKADGSGSIVNAGNLTPIEDTVLYAIYNANGNTAFKVEHYQVDSNGNASLKETTSHKAMTDTTANAVAKNYAHYTLDDLNAKTVSSGNVAGDGSLVLKLYYNIHKNTVNYQVTGNIPQGAPNAPESEAVAYGSNVNVASALTFDGFTFIGWSASGISGTSFSMPDSDVTFTGTWKKNPTIEPPVEKPEVTPKEEPPVVTPPTDDPTVDTPVVTPPTVETPVEDTPEEEPIEEPKEPETSGTEVVSNPGSDVTPQPQTTTKTTQKELVAAAKKAGIPAIGFGDNAVPLIGIAGYDSWSLVDLLLVAIGLVLFIITLLRAIARRRSDGEFARLTGKDEDVSRSVRVSLLITSGITAIAALIVLIATQDLSQPIVLFDGWSVPITALFSGSIVTGKLSLSSKELKVREAAV